MNALDRLETHQGAQSEELLRELMRKCDTRFSDLEQKQQRAFLDSARDISKLRDDLASARESLQHRFVALTEHYGRGGEYIGAFASKEVAADFGRMCCAIVTGNREALATLQRAAVQPGTGESGSYLIAPQFIQGIIRNVEKYGVLEAAANRPPLESMEAFRSKRTQGATCFYPDLGGTVTESTLKFGRVEYRPTRYSSFALVDRWMMQSSALTAIGDLIALELAMAIAYSGDLNGFMGDGTTTYARVTGLFKRNGTGQLIVTGDAGDDTFQEIIDKTVYYLSACAGKLPDWADDDECAWYGHREIFWKYLGAREATTGRPFADILTTGQRTQRVLNGYPYRVVQVAPKMADSGTGKVMLILGNLKAGVDMVRFMNRVELRQSDSYAFLQGQTALVLDSLQDIVETDNQAYVQLKTI